MLAGCSGVPTSSAPQTIEPLDTGGASTPAPVDLTGGARDVVSRFLEANASSSSTARRYLTPAANNRWSDDTATIIGNDYSVGTYNRRDQTVVVYGRVLGTLSASGIYTPSLLGAGGGGDKQQFVFGISRLGRESRIDRLHPGLLLSDEQFRTTYRQQVLYFYNLAEDALVPDLRWSSLDDRQQLAQWLISQIVLGPRPELANAVSLDTMPAHLDPTQIAVQLGSPTLIEIPGSSQLDPAVRDRLAAQLSQTLFDALAGRDMTITDGRVPVLIPRASGASFNASNFASVLGPPLPASAVYYLDGGRIRDENGRVLSGAVANGPPLRSFAISRPGAKGPPLVAGVTGTASSEQLEVGNRTDGLRPTSVRGVLSRPAFVPGRGEVWIGDGSSVYRVNVDGGRPRASLVPIPAVSGGGRVLALRLSPEGSRVALVVSGAGGSAQLYVGSVVRGQGQVRVDGLDPISPKGVVVEDVAWLDSFKLFAIGYLGRPVDARTFETGVDGTDWTNSGLGNLPKPPDTVTAATDSNVWLSANGFVWTQSGNSWVSPGPAGQTPGTAPVYLE
jgi:hypothetical protein